MNARQSRHLFVSALRPFGSRESSCRGRRGGSAPLAGENVVAFLVRWTRSDFRGCTRYTQCGSEGVLRRGRWTWYRPSKWTWSTVVPKARGGSVPLAGGKTSCQGQRRGSAPLAGGKTSCRGRRGGSAPLAGGKTSCQGQRGGSAPLAGGKGSRQGRRGDVEPLVDGESCCQGRDVFLCGCRVERGRAGLSGNEA